MTTSPSSGIEVDNDDINWQQQAPTAVQILGVCGGIGSGKSTVCKLLVSNLKCAAHVDADSVAHTVYEPGSPGVRAIVDEFGSTVAKKNDCSTIADKGKLEIDRAALGAIVFSDRNEMAKLERLVWPFCKEEIKNRIQTIIDENSSSGNNKMERSHDEPKGKQSMAQPRLIIVVEAAMMLDAGWQDDLLDALWAVTVDSSTAIQRLVEQRGMSEQDARQRLAAQASRRGVGNIKEEVEQGTVSAVIDNSSCSLEELQEILEQKLRDPAAWYKPGRKR